MNDERRKAKKFVLSLFFLCICIALVCIGIAAYMIVVGRGQGVVEDRTATICKIIVMTGIFFLVLAFGYLLPILFSQKKADKNNGIYDTSEIFDERNMRHAFEKYIPGGETLLAGIHAISKETVVTCIFENGVCTEDGIVPYENGDIIKINKKKYASYDIYLGITQSFLLVTECEKNMYYYEFDKNPGIKASDIQNVTSGILFSDMGKCFPLTDIQSCEIKNGWMGSVKCLIKMKNGGYFKLMLPKIGGLGGGMPHHTEYREAIIAQLKKFS